MRRSKEERIARIQKRIAILEQEGRRPRMLEILRRRLARLQRM